MTCIPAAVSYKCFPKKGASSISNSLTKFLNGASGGLGKAFDIVDGLDTAVSEISDALDGFTTSFSGLLEGKLIEFIDLGLIAAKNFIFNKITNPLAAIAQNDAFVNAAFKPIGGLFKAFGCLGSTIKKALKSTIKNLLVNMVQKGFINPLECAVQDFIGTLTDKISSLMDSIIGPLIEPINSLFSIVGKGFGSIKGALAGGLNILGKIGGLLACADGGGGKCHLQKEYCLKKQSKKPNSKSKDQNFIAKAIDKGTKKIGNLSGKLDEKTGNLQKLLQEEDFKRDDITCDTGNILDCGLPRVEFFGGGGEGAAGDVILGNFIEEVDNQVKSIEVTDEDTGARISNFTSLVEDVKTTASIIGVDITYPGEGYTSEPLVAFVDNCDQGYGAYGRATIDKDPNSPTFGQITGVVMISEGLFYPTGEETDVFVDHVEIEDGGSGYNLDDNLGDFKICKVDENGSITEMCPNNKAYRTLPNINPISITGSGAILTPVMTRRAVTTGVINVIDCIAPRNNGIVGFVNGKPYRGPFHLHPTRGVKMVGVAHTTSAHAIIYDTPQESLRSGGAPASNVGSTQVNLRSIQQLLQESETETETTTTEPSPSTPSMDTYSDPVDESQNNTPPPAPPSSPPPSSPPPSSPPPSSGSSGGGYGY